MHQNSKMQLKTPRIFECSPVPALCPYFLSVSKHTRTHTTTKKLKLKMDKNPNFRTIIHTYVLWYWQINQFLVKFHELWKILKDPQEIYRKFFKNLMIWVSLRVVVLPKYEVWVWARLTLCQCPGTLLNNSRLNFSVQMSFQRSWSISGQLLTQCYILPGN